jgi:hypothetical protein
MTREEKEIFEIDCKELEINVLKQDTSVRLGR